ncbi:hypothetical protein [Sphingobium sp.]|mgnify:CR=1 FL=1|uniref:hypothetical protein n=1 Tax=Sphingobium sp. TaxID=1912891 RepID=UPI002E1CF40A
MTANDLIDLLVARLLRDHGKTKHHWRKAIGPIRLYDSATHAHCNWSVTPTGTARDVALIEALLDELRLAHPILTD